MESFMLQFSWAASITSHLNCPWLTSCVLKRSLHVCIFEASQISLHTGLLYSLRAFFCTTIQDVDICSKLFHDYYVMQGLTNELKLCNPIKRDYFVCKVKYGEFAIRRRIPIQIQRYLWPTM